jgi:hypothetical protein
MPKPITMMGLTKLRRTSEGFGPCPSLVLSRKKNPAGFYDEEELEGLGRCVTTQAWINATELK